MLRRSSDMSFKWMGIGIGTVWLIALGMGIAVTGTVIWAIITLVNAATNC